jgi:hypothetical protein
VVKLRPGEVEARTSLALLSARLGDLAAYRSACAALAATIGRRSWSASDVAIRHCATLRPDGLEDPEARLNAADGLSFLRSPEATLSALAFVQYRAAHLEAARESALKSIAAYAREMQGPPLPGQKPLQGTRPEEVGPHRDDGAPREWLLLALVEARLATTRRRPPGAPRPSAGSTAPPTTRPPPRCSAG